MSESFENSFFMIGAVVLSDQYGHRLRTAVAERMYNTLYTHGSSIGSDDRGAKRIDGALHQQFTHI